MFKLQDLLWSIGRSDLDQRLLVFIPFSDAVTDTLIQGDLSLVPAPLVGIYLSPAGVWQKTRPTAPEYHSVVLRSD